MYILFSVIYKHNSPQTAVSSVSKRRMRSQVQPLQKHLRYIDTLSFALHAIVFNNNKRKHCFRQQFFELMQPDHNLNVTTYIFKICFRVK